MWGRVKLVDVCREITDGSHFSPKTGAGDWPYVTVRDISEGQIDLLNCARIERADYESLEKNGCRPYRGDVLFSKDGTVGKVAIVDTDDEFVVLSSLAILRPEQSIIEPEFLKYVMLSPDVLDQATGMKTGAAIRRIILKNLKSVEFSLPPKDEQKRLIGVLDRVFESIDQAIGNAECNLSSANELFQTELESIFESCADGVERGFDEVCEITSNLVDPRASEYRFMPHIGAGNIESETGQLSNVLTAEEEKLISGKFVFDTSMVLYSKIRPYLKKVATPDFLGLCSADIYPLKPKAGIITRSYLFHLLLTKRFTDYAISGSDRAGMPKVNRDHLFAFRAKIPPIAEQERVVDHLASMKAVSEKLQDNYEARLSSLAELKRSIFHQVFSGKL